MVFYASSPERKRGKDGREPEGDEQSEGAANLENDTEKKRANIKERLAKIPKSRDIERC